MVISRTGSSLSTTTMSYMNASTMPQVPPLPRNSSYSSHNPTWFDRGGDLNYSFEKTETVPKRQKHLGSHSYHDSGIGPSVRPSPLASNIASEGTSSSLEQSHPFFRSISSTQLGKPLTVNTEVSPIISSGNSTTSTSSDNLEMPRNSNRMSMRPQPIVYAEKDIFDKLHRSTTRKIGEAPLYDSPPIVAKAVTTTTAVPQQKEKRNRWSMLGKKNNTMSAI
jgi:hypothetical protein